MDQGGSDVWETRQEGNLAVGIDCIDVRIGGTGLWRSCFANVRANRHTCASRHIDTEPHRHTQADRYTDTEAHRHTRADRYTGSYTSNCYPYSGGSRSVP